MQIFVNTVELSETLPGDEGAGPVLVPVSSSRTALAFILSSALMLSLPARRYYNLGTVPKGTQDPPGALVRRERSVAAATSASPHAPGAVREPVPGLHRALQVELTEGGQVCDETRAHAGRPTRALGCRRSSARQQTRGTTS